LTVDVYSAGFAPAFTLLPGDSERSGKVTNAHNSVVGCKCKRKTVHDYYFDYKCLKICICGEKVLFLPQIMQ